MGIGYSYVILQAIRVELGYKVCVREYTDMHSIFLFIKIRFTFFIMVSCGNITPLVMLKVLGFRSVQSFKYRFFIIVSRKSTTASFWSRRTHDGLVPESGSLSHTERAVVVSDSFRFPDLYMSLKHKTRTRLHM